MNASILPRLRLLSAVSVLMFSGYAAMAQVEEDTAPPAAETAPAATESAPAPAESAPAAKPAPKAKASKKAQSAPKNGEKPKPDSKQAEGASQSGEKPKSHSKKASAPKAAGGGYATEAEASAHCHGNVVWVGEDHFNHYPGSREWGKKPGSFQCEQ